MRFKRRINRRGSVFDAFYIIAGLLGFALLVVIGGKILGAFNEQVQSSPAFDTASNTSRSITASMNSKWSVLFDNVVLLMWAGAWVAAFILAWFVDSHPVFAVLSLFIMAILVLFSAIISNVYSEFASSPAMQGAASGMVKTNFLFEHFVMINLLMSVILIIVTYAKSQGAGGGGGW